MSRDEVWAFVRRHVLAAVATIGDSGEPQVAIVRFVATETFELVFDTTDATRKAQNLRRRPKVAIAIGWDEGQTVQIEGLADEAVGERIEQLKGIYAQRYPEFYRARQAAKGLVYFRVRPTWMCYSDFRRNPATVLTIDALTGHETRALDPFLGDAAVPHPDIRSARR